MRSFARIVLTVLLALAFLLPALPARADIHYLYDDGDRLTGVLNEEGAGAYYRYDANGNILTIERVGGTGVALMQFSPGVGSAGTEVTLWGTGFGATASANQVSLGGVAAQVLSASANRLVVRVPPEAPTGLITVASAAGRASSRAQFVVTTSFVAPALSGFTPTIGAAGTQVTVRGKYFQPNVLDNRVRFNLSAAGVRAAQATQLITSVPPTATSGPLSIRTRHGLAQGEEDFYVVPPDRTVADIAVTRRMAVGTEASVSLALQKTGLLIFNATQGQRLFLVTSPVDFSEGVTLTLIAPNAEVLFTKNVTLADTHVLRALPVTGTYTLRLDAAKSAGSLTLGVKPVLTLDIDGPSVTASTARPGENLVFDLDGKAGRWLGLGMVNSFAHGSSAGRMWILRPDGSTYFPPRPLNCDQIWNEGNRCSLRGVPTEGPYVLMLDPQGGGTLSTTLTVSTDLTRTLTANAEAATFATQRPGQNVRFTFSAQSGQNVSVTLSENSFAKATTVALWDAAGNEVRANQGTITGTGVVHFRDLPSTGTYSLLVAPQGTGTGSAKVALVSDAQSTLEIDGDTRVLDLLPGQNARLRFSATAGQWLGLGLETDTPNAATAYVKILRPDGKQHSTYVPIDCTRNWSRADRCSLRNLPQDGTYVIEISPSAVTPTRMRWTLSSDLAGAIVPNGEGPVFLIQRPGQNARYRFDAQAGQALSAALIDNQFADSTGLFLFAPDGSYVYGSKFFPRDGVLDFSPLAQSGVYSLWVSPGKANLGRTQVRLLQEHRAGMEVDGASADVTLLPGQNASLRFYANKGAAIGVGIRPRTQTSTMGWLSVSVIKPDGKYFDARWPVNCPGPWNVASRCTLFDLPAEGFYTLRLDPEGALASDVTLSLSTDVRIALSVNGPGVSVRTSRQGQASFLAFSAVAGQRPTVRWQDTTLASARIRLFRPDGREEFARNINDKSAASGSVTLGALSTTGVFTLYVEPMGESLGAVSVGVSSP